MTIDDDARAAFAQRGLLRLPGFLPADRVATACAEARALLAVQGVAGLKRRRMWVDLLGDETPTAAVALMDGRPVSPMSAFPQPLATPPNASSWRVPADAWHVDLPRLPDPGSPGVQIFTFLAPVAPGGGGTLVVAGSHRLVNPPRRMASAQVKRTLARAPWFRDLMTDADDDRRGFLDADGVVDGVEVRVVELCGEPGDVWFADLRLLHALAPNASPTPRLMLTQRYLLTTHRDAVGVASGA